LLTGKLITVCVRRPYRPGGRHR